MKEIEQILNNIVDRERTAQALWQILYNETPKHMKEDMVCPKCNHSWAALIGNPTDYLMSLFSRKTVNKWKKYKKFDVRMRTLKLSFSLSYNDRAMIKEQDIK